MPHKVCPYDATPQCPIEQCPVLLLSIILMSTTKASHYFLSHCNAECGHPEKAEMGGERKDMGLSAFYLV